MQNCNICALLELQYIKLQEWWTFWITLDIRLNNENKSRTEKVNKETVSLLENYA